MSTNTLLLIGSLLFTILIHHGLPYTFLREFHHRLKLHEYIPKILPPNVAPYDMVNVTWDTGAIAWVGNVIPIEQIQNKPKLWWPHNATSYYTVIFTDYDEKEKIYTHPLTEEYHLWFVINIPGIDVSKGDEIFPYILPDCSNGPHRVGVTVYRHKKRDLNYLEEDAINYTIQTRVSFAAFEVAYDFSAYVLGANVFIVEPPPPQKTQAISTTSEQPKGLYYNITVKV